MSFQCVIVTPEQQVMDETVTQAILPAHDGLVGILTSRAPLLVKLGIGPLRIDAPGQPTRHYLIDGGIAQMKDNKLTIVTQGATPASDIDAESARAEYAEAAARKTTDARGREDREKQLARATAKQALAGKK